jgi:hypothetical protein
MRELSGLGLRFASWAFSLLVRARRIVSPPSQWRGYEGQAGMLIAPVECERGEGSAYHVGGAYAVAGEAGGAEGAAAS